MNDLSSSFNPANTRARRRIVQPPPARPQAPRAGAVAVQAAAASHACARGELACRAAWMRVVECGVAGVLALPRDLAAAAGNAAVILDAPSGMQYSAIAAEVDHALVRGVRAGSATALLLLAVIAEARFDSAALAASMADAARTLARDTPEAPVVARLHAALVLARQAPFAAGLQAVDGAGQDRDARAVLFATSLCFGAGAPLAALRQSVAQAHDAAVSAGLTAPVVASELAAWRMLLDALVTPGNRVAPDGEPASFCVSVNRLQLAYYSGDRHAACRAALAAAPLAGALAAPADLLCYHLFAVLALAGDAAPAHVQAARGHRAALDRAATACAANAGAMATLAAAALAGSDNVPGALRGYEAAATLADAHGQGWVAALAWELAAALCHQCGFGAAIPAYRRRALMAWHACGAHGRIAQLCQCWNDSCEGRVAEPGSVSGNGNGNRNFCGHEDEARRVARAGTVGELGVSIAHEVNQPLAAILLQAAAARRWLRRPVPDMEKALDAIEQIAVAGRRAGDIVRSVQDLARRHTSDLSVFAVDAALEEVLRLLSRSLRRHAVTAELALGVPHCQLHANRAQVQQVVINLVLNAIDALATVSDRPRKIVLTLRRLAPDTIDISVADNGPGVAPADRDHIFSALFSTKPNGTGVGLSISRAIAEAHGGHIAYRPQAPHGAVFSLVLGSVAA